MPIIAQMFNIYMQVVPQNVCQTSDGYSLADFE
jgi:hypothetical protein